MRSFGLCIGKVDHYYPDAHAATIRIKDGDLEVGDTLHIVGHGTDVWQEVRRIERDHEPLDHAEAGWSVGIEVDEPVHRKADVFRFHVHTPNIWGGL